MDRSGHQKQAAGTSAAQAQVAGEHPTVMVVDDDPDLLALMKRTLEKGGFTVAARKGPPDWRDLEETRPAVLFMDIGLGDMDGARVCAAMKRNARIAQLPVILISGEERLKEEAKECHADGYLSKPFKQQLLLDLAAHYAERP
ncbi:MAG: response regulator [Bacteroidetes bacterium]|nr:response regulator [Bacteroidota bacterium]